MKFSGLFPLFILVVAIPLAAVSAWALLLQPEHEILWNSDWLYRDCGLVKGNPDSFCVGQYDLAVGNTGEHSEDVVIEWLSDLSGWEIHRDVLNLSADRQRANDPEFSCERATDRTRCSIRNFAAGTYLEITLRCFGCERIEMERLDAGPPVVTSNAKVYRSDPRATLLFRRLSILLGFF